MKRALGMVAVVAVCGAWLGSVQDPPHARPAREPAAVPLPSRFSAPPPTLDEIAIARASIGVSAFSQVTPASPAKSLEPLIDFPDALHVPPARAHAVGEASVSLTLACAAAALVAAQRLRQPRAR